MKSERRHELDTNVLATRLTEWIDCIKPYSRFLTFGALGILAAIVISSYLARSSVAKREAAWDEYTYAMTSVPLQAESLPVVAEDHPGTKMEAWAEITWADYQVARASDLYFRNRADSTKHLEKAREIYESNTAESASALLRDRAHLGLGRIFEMNGDPEKARAMYEKVGGAFAEIAKSRVEALAEPDVDQTFAWLTTAVATAPRAPGGPGAPGEKPLFDTDFSPTPPGGTGEPMSPLGPDVTDDRYDKPVDDAPVDFSFDDPAPAEAPMKNAEGDAPDASADAPSEPTTESTDEETGNTPKPDAPESAPPEDDATGDEGSDGA